MTKVSVIVPIYNVEQYIERCARSLFEQTLDDIEYIFVNDCTPDKSMQILNKVITEYPSRQTNIKIINNQRNLGLPKTRQRGISSATGEYIIHCDSDDWNDLRLYETLYNEAKVKNLDIVWCDFYRIDGRKKEIDKQNTKISKRDILQDILKGKKMGTLWNHLVKRSIIDDNEIMVPVSFMMEDSVVLVQYVFYAVSFGYIPEPLYYYRQHIESVSRERKREKKIWQAKEMDKNISLMESFFKKVGIAKNLKYYIEFRKYFNKRWLTPLIQNATDCDLWIREYPEINKSLYFNPVLTIKDKLSSLLIELRIYPYLRKLIRRR